MTSSLRTTHPQQTSGTDGASKKQPIVILGALLLIAIMTAAIYRQTIFSWFCSDDFVILEWLDRVSTHPELILRNFMATWLDVPTTRFYRPLWGVSMAIDYFVWGRNFAGFHLTNVLLHIANVGLVFVVSRHLLKISAGVKSAATNSFALAAAALFAAHPIHPEAVAWVTGRVDAIVTMFYLSTLWCYMRWRSGGTVTWLLGACLSACAAFGSKEMAISLPAMISCCEIVMYWQVGSGSVRTILHQSLGVVKRTAWFWAILAGYFIIRRVTLGTFVGGYDDGLIISDWSSWSARMSMSMHTLLFPINVLEVTASNAFAKLWTVALCLSTVAILIRVALYKELRRVALFLPAWFAITLVPLYRVMSIATDLQQTRYAYLPSVPLCMLFALAVAGCSWNSREKLKNTFTAFCIVSFSLLLSSGAVLCWKNNRPWVQAGQESNKIMLAFDKLFANADPNNYILVFGLPDNIKGAPVARNAPGGLTRFRNVLVSAPDLENGAPYGFWKQSMKTFIDRVHVFRWNSEKTGFTPVTVSPQSGAPLAWHGEQLSRLLVPPNSIAQWHSSGLELNTKGMASIDLRIDGTNCWTYDVLIVTLQELNHNNSPFFADLHFSNGVSLARTVTATANKSAQGTSLIFLLHRSPAWLLGAQARDVSLTVPVNTHILITDVELKSAESFMPTLNFPNSGCTGNGNRLYFAPNGESVNIDFDASNIPGASGCILDLTRSGKRFDETGATPSDSDSSVRAMKIMQTKGSFRLTKSLFVSNEMRCARARAIDSDGNYVGAPSDFVAVWPSIPQ